MTVTTVIGIDAALTATGVAVWRDGRMFLDTIRTHPPTPLPARWRQVTSRIWPCITSNTLVVKEAVFKGLKGDAALRLAELHAVIVDGLYGRDVPYAEVDNKKVKQYATNNGGSDKAAMVAAAHNQLGALAWANDDNQADALWLMAMGLHHYGHPVVSGPAPWRIAAMAGVAWPAWRMPQPPQEGNT